MPTVPIGLVGLTEAVAAASDGRIRLDRVQLLVTTAELVETDRALAAAQRHLGDDDLVALLALLEPTALTARRRSVASPTRSSCSSRSGTRAPRSPASSRPNPTELHRFSDQRRRSWPPRSRSASTCSSPSSPMWPRWATSSPGAICGWVLATFVLGQLPQFSQAVAMLGAVSARLPLGPVTGVQFANAFTGLVGGTAGNATLTIRFFQKQGLPPAVAASSGRPQLGQRASSSRRS